MVDVGSGVLTRGMYAFLNPDMSADEKSEYVFDLKQMEVDFLTGVAMHFAFQGVTFYWIDFTLWYSCLCSKVDGK